MGLARSRHRARHPGPRGHVGGGRHVLAARGETGHDPAFLDLALASLDRWASFADALRERGGTDVEYLPAGKLHVAFNAEHSAHLRSLVERGAGFGVQALTGREARRLEPTLSTEVAAAVLVGRDHRVDVRRLAEVAWRAAERDGAEFLVGTTARRLELAGEGTRRFEAVLFDGGARIAADHVVIAGGAWSG